VKSYELLTAEAAVTGSYQTAYLAMLAHPLGPAASKVETVLNDLLDTHRAHLPQFWKL
jgi:6-phospho-beta-glucosidase